MAPSRVLVTVPSVPASLDADVPWHFFQELRALASYGINVCVVSPVQPDYEIDGIEFRAIGPAPLRSRPWDAGRASGLALKHRPWIRMVGAGSWRQQLRLWRWNQCLLDVARRWKPDVIHSHWAFPAGSGGMLAARELRVPLVMTLRGIEHLVNADCGYGDCLDPFYESTLRQALGAADRITICCADSAKRLAELGIEGDEKIEMVYHAVGKDRFQGSDSQAQQLKSDLGLADRSIITCVAGMDHLRKGHTTLLDAFARVHAEHPDTALVFVGDGPLRPQFEARATELGIRSHLHIVGRVHPMQVQHYMRMATVTVLPTRTEVFGNVAFESLYVGTPVVASKVGAPGDVLPQGPYGLTFQPGNTSQLADALLNVLDDLPHARTMAESGGELVRKYMSLENRASKFISIYEQLTGNESRQDGGAKQRSPEATKHVPRAIGE